jgi:hypothetical protein
MSTGPRLWLERAGYGLVAVVAIGFPLLMGFLFYLGFSDGLVLNEGDVMRQTHIFMVRDSRNAGIAWTRPVSAVPVDPASLATCVRTQFSHLRVRPRISIERNAETCTCYIEDGFKWKQLPLACAAQ